MSGDAIGNNLSALSARGLLKKNNEKLHQLQNELASGSLVHEASKNPAKAAVSAQLSSQIRGLVAASQNIAQSESLLQFVAGSLSNTQDLLVKLYDLTVQSNTELIGDQDREIINDNFSSILDQIQRNAEITWGDTPLLSGGLGSANTVDTPSSGTQASSGFVMGTVDAESINVTFTGSSYHVNLSINGQVFQGIATPNVSGGAIGHISLTSVIDSGTKLTIPNVNFTSGSPEETVIQSIKTATGSNTGNPIQYIPANTMSKVDADNLITTIIPGSSNVPGYHFLTYGTDGTNAVFKWQNNRSVKTTTIPIQDLVTKFSTTNTSSAASFSGTFALNDGTKITLSNANLTNNNLLPGTLVNIEAGESRILKVQTGEQSHQISTLTFTTATISGLGLFGENVLSVNNARAAGIAIKKAIDVIAAQIGHVGGFKAQLHYTGRNVDVLIENQIAAQSEIADTDIPTALIETQKHEALVDLSSTGIFNSLKKTEKLVTLVQRVRGTG